MPLPSSSSLPPRWLPGASLRPVIQKIKSEAIDGYEEPSFAGRGGFYVLENLKNSVVTNDIPVLVMIALPEKDLEEKAVNLGAAGFIRKPFEPDLLLSSIRELLSGGEKQEV
jgi:CheY-like chemotaxis protein